jgi:shikimate kinase
VLHESGFAALAATGIVVYLEVGEEELAARSQQRPRPPLTTLTPREEINALLAQRRPLYEKAAQIKIHATSDDPILGILQALGLG